MMSSEKDSRFRDGKAVFYERNITYQGLVRNKIKNASLHIN